MQDGLTTASTDTVIIISIQVKVASMFSKFEGIYCIIIIANFGDIIPGIISEMWQTDWVCFPAIV